jgi:hypothetical protein
VSVDGDAANDLETNSGIAEEVEDAFQVVR